jgi:hypothetical protein
MLLSTIFFFGVTVEAANWSPPVKIESIEISNINTQGKGVWLSFATAPYVSHTCSAKNGQYRLGGTDDNIKEMTSIATAALVNSRNVTVYWKGDCDGGGMNGYPILMGLTLK